MAGERGPTPKSDVYICDCHELPIDYSHTYIFKTKEEQKEYFRNRVRFTFTDYTYLRKDDTITVNLHVDDFQNCNYLFYQNGVGKIYYCFIIGREYINEHATKIYISTDLIQTNWFELRLEPSYIDRMHVDRWYEDGRPTEEFEPEGLEFGEYVEDTLSPRVLAHQNDNYIAVCSNPLGKIVGRQQWGGENKPGTGGNGHEDVTDCNWREGQLSPEGFRFIKGEEGFAPQPYWDIWGKVWTIGYGITQPSEPDAYDYLVKKGYATEEDCAVVSYWIKNNRYGKDIVQACIDGGVTKQYQFDALLSLSYNVGPAYIKNPNSSIRKAMKQGITDETIMTNAFLQYTSGGLLTERRKEEAKMFLGKAYRTKSIDIIDQKGRPTMVFKGDGWLPKCKGGGGKPDIPSGPNSFNALGLEWTYPCEGTISSKFYRCNPPHPWHGGIDIANVLNTPIYAPRDITIERLEVITDQQTYPEKWGSYGRFIVAKVDNSNYKIWFAHLKSWRSGLKVGDKISRGELLCYMGTSGYSSGVHLHYEIRKAPYSYGEKGDNVDPMPNVSCNQVIKYKK